MRPLLATFCQTLFFFCHHNSVLTDEHAFNVPELSPWWDVSLGGATQGTAHALLGVSLMLVHDSKWVGQSWHQCTGLFLDASQHLPAGWLCLGVWVHTHTKKKETNLTHTHTHTLQGPRMMVRGNEVTQLSRMVAVHSPVSTVRRIHLYNTLVDSFLAKIKAYLTQVWRPAVANMNFGWWLSVSTGTQTKLCVERKPTVSLCSHSPYQSFLKNIACKCQCLWPNLYIFSVIYSYSSFFFSLYIFCTVLHSSVQL